MQQSTEYGYRKGPQDNVEMPIGASEVFKKKGGAFMQTDGSGRAEIATAAATDIVGHAMFNEDFTASSTEGATKLPINRSLEAWYELPVSGTWADTMLGEDCDIIVTSSIQYANLAAATTRVLNIVQKGTTNAAGTVVSVIVKLNPRLIVHDTVV